jgi:zinc transporter 1
MPCAVYKTGKILLESVPKGVDLDHVQQDLEKVRTRTNPVYSISNGSMLMVLQVPGIVSVHELHVWRLNQQKSIASAHIVVSDKHLPSFVDLAKTVSECLHAYGIHSATLQPELDVSRLSTESAPAQDGLRRRAVQIPVCTINCGNANVCQSLQCCG